MHANLLYLVHCVSILFLKGLAIQARAVAFGVLILTKFVALPDIPDGKGLMLKINIWNIEYLEGLPGGATLKASCLKCVSTCCHLCVKAYIQLVYFYIAVCCCFYSGWKVD